MVSRQSLRLKRFKDIVNYLSVKDFNTQGALPVSIKLYRKATVRVGQKTCCEREIRGRAELPKPRNAPKINYSRKRRKDDVMDLFTLNAENILTSQTPLANKVRPENLNEFLGQTHIVGETTFLKKSINADKIPSMILTGPSGTGKTTLAKIIAKSSKSQFVQINATTSGVKDIKETIENAKHLLGTSAKKTILFIDEIHRFNKSQQDALLPFVEDGTITLIGATTENPYFEVNAALLSRTRVLTFDPLTENDVVTIIENAISSKNGLANYNLEISQDAIRLIANISNGDARIALNILELAVDTTPLNENAVIFITNETISNCASRNFKYDKSGENHYNTISAFIKSMRGSDPDAAVYYLARLIVSGEDLKFIARRIVISAAEDVGLADPNALVVANAAATAAQFVGFPEARIILSEAVIYIATAPKSNSAYLAIDRAIEDVKNINVSGVPSHLCDSHSTAKNENSKPYKYAHDYPNNYVDQQYLPDELANSKYYNPCENGFEPKITEHMNNIKRDL